MDWATFKEIIKVPLGLFAVIYFFMFLVFFTVGGIPELYYIINGLVLAIMFYVGHTVTKKGLPLEAVSYFIVFFVGITFIVDAIPLTIINIIYERISMEALPIAILLGLGFRFILFGVPCFIGAYIGKRNQHS